jgi:hypothetical protein
MEEIMPSMTDAMDRLAQSIARSRRARAEAAVPRSKHVHAVLALHRHDRLALHRHQRRQLTAYMNDLTAKVGTLRAGFRAGLESLRSKQPGELAVFVTNLSASVGTLRAGFRSDLAGQRAAWRRAAHSVHQQLDEVRRDRHAAGDAWRGHKVAHREGAHTRTEGGRPS